MTELRSDDVEADEGSVEWVVSGQVRYVSDTGHQLDINVSEARYQNDPLGDGNPTVEVKHDPRIKGESSAEIGDVLTDTFTLEEPCSTAQEFIDRLPELYGDLQGLNRFQRWIEENTADELESGSELVSEDPDERELVFRTWYKRGDHEGSIRTEFKLDPWGDEGSIVGKAHRRFLGKNLMGRPIELDAEDVDDFDEFRQRARDEHDRRADKFRQDKFSEA